MAKPFHDCRMPDASLDFARPVPDAADELHAARPQPILWRDPVRPARRNGGMLGRSGSISQAALALAFITAAMAGAAAQGSSHGQPGAAPPAGLSQDEKWRRRFPQPVLVSDLIGRLVLDTGQGVLGRIETLVRSPDEQVQIVFVKRSLVGFRGDTVAIPAKAAALLGRFVMVLDLSKEDVDNLPAWTKTSMPAIERSSKIEMALTKH